MIFVDILIGFCVPREVLWRYLEARSVHVGYIRVIKYMYDGAKK